MFSQIIALTINNLRAILRDRILHAICAVAVVMILLVPSMSSFSMRQVQELAITLSLSAVSLSLLVITLLLGASSIWRDIERRYTTSILTLPLSRSTYLLSRFAGIAVFLAAATLLLSIGSVVVIKLAAVSYPSDVPIHWENIVLALAGNLFKYILLAAFALLLSAVSTSFFLPFFGTVVMYLCGSASQEVYEYVSGQLGQGVSPLAAKIVTGTYYLIPNFAAFDFQVQAIYGLDVPYDGLLLVVLYTLVYTGILLGLAIFAFNRRQLP